MNWAKSLLKDKFNTPIFFYTDNDPLTTAQLKYHISRGLSVVDFHSYLTKAEYENDYMIRYQTLLNHVFDYQNDQNAGQNKFERFEWVHKKLSPFLLMNAVRPSDINKQLSPHIVVEDNGRIISLHIDYNILEYFYEIMNMSKDKRADLGKDVLDKYCDILNVFNKALVFTEKKHSSWEDQLCIQFSYNEMLKYTKKKQHSLEDKFIKAFYLAKLANYKEAYNLYLKIEQEAFKVQNYLLFYLSQINRNSLYHTLSSINRNFLYHNDSMMEDVEEIEIEFSKLPIEFQNQFKVFENLHSIDSLLYSNFYNTFIVGNVTAPYGLTAYNTTDFGGLKGDNGFMARMKSGKDITIEGIGTNACINGWGLHFICEESAPEFGKSFEVRNLAFRNVPEDAVGMEGVQANGVVTASVERCWIHNNEFYVPNIEKPAESDKKQGDGACDFKRGQYFTNSYNYYEGYHKTNLVGANDSNLQYNISFHNNYWKDCAARGPLARQANIHLYNNIYEHQTDVGQDSRANSYFFSEYNLFENCDDCTVIKSGGAIKSFNDSFVNCEHETTGTVVTSKTEAISNNNKYPDFDTNASLSYIPAGDYILQTDTTKLKSNFEINGGTMDENSASAMITDTDPVTVSGDVNADGELTMADVVLL